MFVVLVYVVWGAGWCVRIWFVCVRLVVCVIVWLVLVWSGFRLLCLLWLGDFGCLY